MTKRYNVDLQTTDMYPSIKGKCSCGCGLSLPKGRRRWLNDEHAAKALREYWIRKGSTPVIRSALFERDRGVCSRCGKDTEAEKQKWQEIQRYWQWHVRRMLEENVTMLGNDKVPRRVYIGYETRRIIAEHVHRATGMRDITQHWWEAHHVHAVSEGGGGCGLDGYETLCRPCHHSETKELRRRLRKNAKHRTVRA